jgi:alkylhydroperoxidase family enzyme
MPRPLPSPSRDAVRDEEHELWDKVLERHNNQAAAGFNYDTLARGAEPAPVHTTVPGYYGALLNAPAIGFHINAIGRLVREAGDHDDSYTHADREWVDMVLCHDWKTNVVMTGHLEDAIVRGVRPEAIKALRDGREEDLTDDERQLTDYIRMVRDGRVTDEAFDALQARMGDRGATEYTAFIGYLMMTMRLISALTGDDGPTDDVIDGRLQAFLDGSAPLPTEPLIPAG